MIVIAIDMPEVLTPSTLLTQRSQSLKAAPGNFSQVNLYSRQCRKFQYLANVSWAHWRKSIYQCFNPGGSGNKKLEIWRKETLLLLCSKELPRNSWPLAHITKAYISEDGKLCKKTSWRLKTAWQKSIQDQSWSHFAQKWGRYWQDEENNL